MGTKTFIKKRCEVCHGAFRTSNGSVKCYNCIMAGIAPDRVPTEAEKRKAEQLSGCMSLAEVVDFYNKRTRKKDPGIVRAFN